MQPGSLPRNHLLARFLEPFTTPQTRRCCHVPALSVRQPGDREGPWGIASLRRRSFAPFARILRTAESSVVGQQIVNRQTKNSPDGLLEF